MKDILIINSLIEKELDVIQSYENYIDSMSEDKVNCFVKDSIGRHNNHIESLKKISEEVR